MARVLKVFGYCLSVLTLWACGQSSLTPARPVPRGDIETRITQPKPGREIPRLIAPPPAYGNKIVMARAEARSLNNE